MHSAGTALTCLHSLLMHQYDVVQAVFDLSEGGGTRVGSRVFLRLLTVRCWVPGRWQALTLCRNEVHVARASARSYLTGCSGTHSPQRAMRALAVTLAIGLLAVVSDGHLVHQASTGKVEGLRWQPSHGVGHQSRRLQQSTPSSFASANNITSTIVNATRDGGFLVVSKLVTI